MKKQLSLILMAAGDSNRFYHSLPPHKKIKKQWLRIGYIPLWKKVLQDLKALYNFHRIFIGMDKESLNYAQKFCTDGEIIVCGGASRAQTLRNILQEAQSDFVFVTDVARCNLDVEVCKNLLKNFEKYDCSVPYLDCSDTIIYENHCIHRQKVKLIQTPQISNLQKLQDALAKKDYTDESSAMLDNGYKVRFIKGSPKMQKLTTLQDLYLLNHLPPPKEDSFSGSGIDIHQFEPNKPMFLGGINLHQSFGFKAHSDGDVLLHALIDALLGAMGGGDIGEWFADNDTRFYNINSTALLEIILNFITSVGYEILNVDFSIIAQKPKISPHKQAIETNLAKLLHLPKHCINIKATTAEKMGFIGREEGICVLANATLKFINWKELK